MTLESNVLRIWSQLLIILLYLTYVRMYVYVQIHVLYLHTL